ncbi:MAG: hypothetical protein FWF02_06825 [Micrococcales bacterium]|nr:hypothetical protein [Micrococcales bacterium]MCL2667406.1 hypothetical protein [Micrococcales bacterium]
MAVEWADSADKHGVDREDALHAMQNHHLRVLEFDEPRQEGAGRPDLYLGPPRPPGGPILEIMVERVPPRTLVVFHVMQARQKYLELLEEGDPR